MSIQHSYVVWIGADHYATAAEFVEEVRQMGLSKRLPGIGMANALDEPGTVVFLAHDDGEAYSCDACMGQVECASCRAQQHLILKWQGEAETVRRRYGNEKIPRGKERIIEIRGARIAEARAAMAKCKLCHGEQTYECGTGGYVVRADGSRMAYRAYSYWIRQPAKFDAVREVAERHMCEVCGGTGKRPDAMIFGAFVPTIEVVLDGRESEVTKEHNKRFERKVTLAKVAKEPERQAERPSRTKRGAGYYASARAGKPTKRALAVAETLSVRRIVRGEFEVIGDVIVFAKPIKAGELKRFRGVAHWALPTQRGAVELSA